MKYLSFLFLIFLSLTFLSCNDEDNLPVQLSGVWEERNYVDSVDFWVVNTLEFKNDSEFQFRTTVRETETGNDLGYRFYYDDTYDWDGKTFNYSPDMAFWIDYREEKFYTKKEDLKAGVIDFVSWPSANITFVEGNSKLIFQNICTSTNADYCENAQYPEREYIRVN